eukprot:m.41252 g.41252  ORF g.41252 m.41252 type:complete len:156 (+) comp11441_c0_seq1:905-1372(+)
MVADWVPAPTPDQPEDDDEPDRRDLGYFDLLFGSLCSYGSPLIRADVEVLGTDGVGQLLRIELGKDVRLRDTLDRSDRGDDGDAGDGGVGDPAAVFGTVFDPKAGGTLIAGGYSRPVLGPLVTLAPTAPPTISRENLQAVCNALAAVCNKTGWVC